ncbi:MAG TPA: pyridoxal 5'-phosphate synthase glutaminase subunit PdxT [Planctomycetes bacterium]|nr:pyridoxal 5'-phosphate synthase glutaminase subunit PdxT [Planctomycetota bacterium]
MALTVGVLALQGSVEPHFRILQEIGVAALEVRKPESLEAVTHLVIPGGESTTLWRLLCLEGLWEILRKRGSSGSLAILGTCAGAIILGMGTEEDPPPRLELIDVPVSRNAYGRQIDSFICPVELCKPYGKGEMEGVFIRAPGFGEPGSGVEVVAEMAGAGVAFRQGRCLVTAFHPELTSDLQLHRSFLEI